jgi:hypothetical protein
VRGPVMHCFDLLLQRTYGLVAVPVAATGFEQGRPDRGTRLSILGVGFKVTLPLE